MNKFSTPGYVQDILDTASVKFAGQNITADEYSNPISLKGYLFAGLALDYGTVGGSSPTLDVTLEISFDGGTVWFNLPEDVNSTTQCAMTQATTTGQKEFKYFAIPAAAATTTEGTAPKIRALFNVGGTSPSFGVDSARWVLFAGTN